MKKFLIPFGLSGILILTCVIGVFYGTPIHAQTGVFSGSNGSTQTNTSSSDCPSGQICNPIKATSIQCFIKDAVDLVLEILSVAAVLYIIWAGFLFVKAQGNDKELEGAKKALLNALIGTAIILGAWVFATTIANTITKITNQNVSLDNTSSCT